jgi:hypothetical protein
VRRCVPSWFILPLASFSLIGRFSLIKLLGAVALQGGAFPYMGLSPAMTRPPARFAPQAPRQRIGRLSWRSNAPKNTRIFFCFAVVIVHIYARTKANEKNCFLHEPVVV